MHRLKFKRKNVGQGTERKENENLQLQKMLQMKNGRAWCEPLRSGIMGSKI